MVSQSKVTFWIFQNKNSLNVLFNYLYMESIGSRLRKYLEFKGVSRKEFATDIDIIYSSLNRILNSDRAMNSETLGKVLDYFPDLNARWFLTGKGPMEYTSASYHLDPVLEQSHDTMKEVDEYIKNLSEEDIKRLEEQGVKVKFDTTDYSKELDEETIESLLQEFIKKDEVRDVIRQMIKENKEK